MGLVRTMSWAVLGWSVDQGEERLKSGNTMEAAIAMAVSGEDAEPVQVMGAGEVALLGLLESEIED